MPSALKPGASPLPPPPPRPARPPPATYEISEKRFLMIIFIMGGGGGEGIMYFWDYYLQNFKMYMAGQYHLHHLNVRYEKNVFRAKLKITRNCIPEY